MSLLSQSLLASTLALLVAAQTSTVTNVFIPFADQQPLDASIIAQHNDVATLAIQCAPGTDASDCGFPEPLTVTAGPSTFHLSASGTYVDIGILDCTITGTTQAFCTAVQGVYDTASIATGTDSDWETVPASTSTSTSATLTGDDMVFVPVTITAGLEKAAAANSTSATTTTSGKTTSSGGGSSATSGSTAKTGSGSASATATASSSAAIASTTKNTAAGVSAGMVRSGGLLALAMLPVLLL